MAKTAVVSSEGLAPSNSRRGFPNMAGVADCDDVLAAELEAAGITVHRIRALKDGKREVDTEVMGSVDPSGWGFRRAWYYWLAEGPGLPPADAWELYRAHGRDVRVVGYCDCPDPGYLKGFGVGLYHVDTPAGLKALADTIKRVLHRHEGKADARPPATLVDPDCGLLAALKEALGRHVSDGDGDRSLEEWAIAFLVDLRGRGFDVVRYDPERYLKWLAGQEEAEQGEFRAFGAATEPFKGSDGKEEDAKETGAEGA